MSFAFTAVRPETQGQDTDMTVPMMDYLSASFEAGWGGTLGKIHDFGKYLAEAGDDTSPMLTPEQLNQDYPVAEKWTAPARESVGMLLASKHEEEMRRSFYLQNDNHSFVAGAMGMGTSMVASILNPVDLALMFVPVVGPGARLGPVTETEMAAGALGRVGRFREALNTGILTTRGELAYATRFPYLAENVIQNTGFAVTAEGVNQIVAAHYKQDAGNPLLNIASNVALGATIHGALNILGKVWHSLPSSLKEEMLVKAMDDFVKGKDIQVDEHLRTAEAFAKWQVAAHEDWIAGLMSHEDAPLKQEPLNIETFQAKIKGIYDEALNKLRADLLPKAEKPVVPMTGATPEQVAFSSMLDEIRQKNLRTKESIRELYPQLTREEAAVLRRQAWNETEVKAQHEQNLNDLFEKAKERNANKQMGAKRLARIAAEQNMPNPIPEAQLVEAVHEVVVPADSTIAKVEEGAKKAEKKVKAKEPKPKKEKPVTPIQEKAKAIGLTPMKGALGKKGYFTTTDPRFKGLSVIINDEGIHLNSIEAAEQGKGAGTEMLNKLKALADEMDKPITLTAEANERLGGIRKEILQKETVYYRGTQKAETTPGEQRKTSKGVFLTQDKMYASSFGISDKNQSTGSSDSLVTAYQIKANLNLLKNKNTLFSLAAEFEKTSIAKEKVLFEEGQGVVQDPTDAFISFLEGKGYDGWTSNKGSEDTFIFNRDNVKKSLRDETLLTKGGDVLDLTWNTEGRDLHLVAKKKNGTFVGALQLEQTKNGGFYPVFIEVKDPFKRQGIATQLWKTAEKAGYVIEFPKDLGPKEYTPEGLAWAQKQESFNVKKAMTQAKLEAWYEKNGFTRVKGNEFIYEPMTPAQRKAELGHAENVLEDFALNEVLDKRFAPNAKYWPVVKNSKGEVFDGSVVTKEQLKKAEVDQAGHDQIINALSKEQAVGLQTGFATKQDAFLTLLDVARKEIKDAEIKEAEVLKANEFIKNSNTAKTESTVETVGKKPLIENWDLFNENLHSNLDSWHDARGSAKVNYDLMDLADAFVEYAKNNPEATIEKTLTEFRKTADASKRNLTRLAESVKQEFANLSKEMTLQEKLKAEGEAKLKQMIEEAKPRPDIIEAATDCIIKNII